MSPQQFLTTFRITKARELLESTNYPIESIALSCGYSLSLIHIYQQDYNGTLRIAGKHGDRCRNDQDYDQQISKLTDKYLSLIHI